MKKLYEKTELGFALMWIGIYCVAMSVGDNLSANIGIEKIITLPIALILSIVLICFLKKNDLFKKYGLCKSRVSAKQMLYYLPIFVLLTANLWYDIKLNLSVFETVLYILVMLGVGFLEEIIFRGLLFNAMLKDNVKAAIIVSSLTFGMGHIINLINGSGAEFLPNMMQVVYASAAGFMFVMIYYRTKSLLICIITHGVFNALSVFANEAGLAMQDRMISCVLLVLISGGYAIYIALKIRKDYA